MNKFQMWRDILSHSIFVKIIDFGVETKDNFGFIEFKYFNPPQEPIRLMMLFDHGEVKCVKEVAGI